MVLSSIPDPPGFYRLCIVAPSGGCRVGFFPELVAGPARRVCGVGDGSGPKPSGGPKNYFFNKVIL
ncbi:hypothetical protein Hanom_Chr17g01561091 [Helianthus anomalus]